jgi:ribosome-binding factor A
MSGSGYKRSDRVADQIRAEVADIIATKLKDPRVGFATVIAVEVTDDIRYAKVFVSVLGDAETENQTFEGLNAAASFIRGELGRRVRLRHIPQIEFVPDHTAEEAERLTKLITSSQAPMSNEGHSQNSLQSKREGEAP